jgi:hypothetical protein
MNCWFLASEELRSQIKEALLCELGSEDDNRIKNASLCLAMIGRVEIPLNLWDGFLEVMKTNATESTNIYHRLAAVQTLGYLSEFMGDEHLKQQHVESILHSTILNIEEG